MRLPALLAMLACLAAPGLLAAPAEAKLNGTIPEYAHSKLLSDTLFRYEGRIGARYRFGGARHCRFGQGVLAVDVQDTRIVQQIMVLPLPTSSREERMLQEVARLFIEDAGLDADQGKAALAAFEDAYTTGHATEKTLGEVELHTQCDPTHNALMIALSVKR
jgi:hypothetical protein